MREVRHRRWLRVFSAVTFLVLLQIAWWTTAFLQNINHIESLTSENLNHRRLMFVSEGAFFTLVICVGFYLLYRALKMEERSRETQRNFIEIVTHESKTPLTALKLRLESVQEKQGDGKLKSDLGLALDEVRRLSSIFDKAMSLNRVEREAFTLEPLDLSDAVKEVARRLDPFLKSKKVDLQLALDPDTVVKGDPYGIQSVVQSLIENAVLYNPEPVKKVEIRVRKVGTRILMNMSDNGPGINEADKARLFERFYRGKQNQSVPGTGLGLYIVKTILEAHHGEIRLSPSPQGTHFEIEFPAGEA